jgi:hypothetical protein
MRGEGVRHPTTSVQENGYLLPNVFFLFAKPKFVGFYYVQMSRFPSYDIPKMANVM